MWQSDQIREDVLRPDHKTLESQVQAFQQVLNEQSRFRVRNAPETGGTNAQQDDNPADKDKAFDRFLRSDPKVVVKSFVYAASGLKAQSQSAQKSGTQRMGSMDETGLSEDEKAMVKELSKRDRDVKMHEQVHAAMLGRYAGSIRYDYQIGPDGHAYAIGGSIEVKTAYGGSDEENLQEARTIQRAAMGVENPSSADMSVAIKAEQKARQSTFNRVA